MLVCLTTTGQGLASWRPERSDVGVLCVLPHLYVTLVGDPLNLESLIHGEPRVWFHPQVQSVISSIVRNDP